MDPHLEALTAGVGIFVKTPGLSPLKTRLAGDTSPVVAARFYELSCRAVAASVGGASRCRGYWAVAEEAALTDERWRELGPPLWQGDAETLGPRLDRVYRELLARHGVGILLGADGPLVRPEHLERALAHLEAGADFVLGPAADGGFWLFAGKRPVPLTVWEGVAYSAETTAAELVAALPESRYRWARLERLSDVDRGPDLERVRAELVRARPAHPAHEELLRWLEQFNH